LEPVTEENTEFRIFRNSHYYRTSREYSLVWLGKILKWNKELPWNIIKKSIESLLTALTILGIPKLPVEDVIIRLNEVELVSLSSDDTFSKENSLGIGQLAITNQRNYFS
jgi:hypothetical protein